MEPSYHSDDASLVVTTTFCLRIEGNLAVPAKRYRFPVATKRARSHCQRPTILILAHALGYHKEHWEPTLDELVRVIARDDGTLHISEAWAIDAPDHGEGSVLNEAELTARPRIVTCHEYGHAINTLCSSGLLDSTPGSRIVLVGHSAGAATVLLSTNAYAIGEIPFERIILVEPAMIDPSIMASSAETRRFFSNMSAGSAKQRDIWPSRNAAKEWLQTRKPFKAWDERVLDIFVQHGLQPLPTALYPDVFFGVTLRASAKLQSLAYTAETVQYDALERLGEICDTLPVHVVFGGIVDYGSRTIQDAICDPLRGRNVASVTRIPGAGHTIVQEVPQSVAKELHSLLATVKENTKL